MATAVTVRADFSADELRRLATASKHANQSWRLLSLAAVLDGMSRADAARIGGMDRQTLRDWVHRFNERGPEGLKDSWSKGHPPRLSAEQLAQLAQVVETGPERAVHGIVRWRRVDLQQIVAERFGVAYHERTIGKILKQLGFSHVSARPRHPAKDEETVAAFKSNCSADSDGCGKESMSWFHGAGGSCPGDSGDGERGLLWWLRAAAFQVGCVLPGQRLVHEAFWCGAMPPRPYVR